MSIRLELRAILVAMILCATVCSACTGSSCSGAATWSFRVRVRDGATGASICDAAVTASNGSTQTTLTCFGGADCICVGVSEQLGTFHITVTKSGYEPAATTILVDEKTSGECSHVKTKDVTITLVPV